MKGVRYSVVKPKSAVLKIANAVVGRFKSEFSHVDLNDVQFSWRFSKRSIYHGKTSLIRGVHKMFTDKKVVIVLFRKSWKSHDRAWRSLLVYHELRHIVAKKENGDYVLKRHDVEDFADVISKYGIRWEGASKFLEQLDRWPST
jgi:hypothetical protein